MKILYGIQGTGNGHFSRAIEVIPHLRRYGELDLLVSGNQVDLKLPHPVKFQYPGLSYTFGNSGNIDITRTLTNLKPIRFASDIRALPVSEYDLVISDFEPISAWAARLKHIPVVALSHQAAFLSAKSPRPAGRNRFVEMLFYRYAPSTSAIGFHFDAYDNFIHKPIIRREIRVLHPAEGDHITVYLPAYHESVLAEILRKIPQIQWHIFAKTAGKPRSTGNITIFPVDQEHYLKSLEGSRGLLTGGGFEAPSEALFLGKKLMVVPMQMQYEQQCNAEALRRMGVPSLQQMAESETDAIREWLFSKQAVQVNYEDTTAEIIRDLIDRHNSRKLPGWHNFPRSQKMLTAGSAELS